jgi:hypothetical protein
VRLYAGEVLKERKLLKDVWLYRFFPDYTERVYAPNGKWEVTDNRLSLTLLDGQIERFVHGPEGDFLHIAYKIYTLGVPLQMTPTDARSRNWREYTTPELRREINRRTILDLPVGELKSEYHLALFIGLCPVGLGLDWDPPGNDH